MTLQQENEHLKAELELANKKLSFYENELKELGLIAEEIEEDFAIFKMNASSAISKKLI